MCPLLWPDVFPWRVLPQSHSSTSSFMEALLDIKCSISVYEFSFHCLAIKETAVRLSIFAGHMTIWNKTRISWPSLCLMWLTRLVRASGIWEQILCMTSEEGPYKDPLCCGWECKFKMKLSRNLAPCGESIILKMKKQEDWRSLMETSGQERDTICIASAMLYWVLIVLG